MFSSLIISFLPDGDYTQAAAEKFSAAVSTCLIFFLIVLYSPVMIFAKSIKEKIMKKKVLALTIVFVVLLLLVPACTKKAPGQISSEALLAMVPEGPSMLMAFNFQQFAALDLFDKMIKDDWQKNAKAGKAFKNYGDFVKQTGIDLQKDVFAVVGAMYGGVDSENQEMVGIVNLKYDADKLLAVLKKNQAP